MKRKPPPIDNPYAKDLRTPKYKMRTVKMKHKEILVDQLVDENLKALRDSGITEIIRFPEDEELE